MYAELLAALRAAGAEWVQLDEPALVSESLPVPAAQLAAAAERAYAVLGGGCRASLDPRRGVVRAAVDRGVERPGGRPRRGARHRPRPRLDPRAGGGIGGQDRRGRRHRRSQCLARRPRGRLGAARGASSLGAGAIAVGHLHVSAARPPRRRGRAGTRPAPRVLACVRRPEGRRGRDARAWPEPRASGDRGRSAPQHPPPSPTGRAHPVSATARVRRRTATLTPADIDARRLRDARRGAGGRARPARAADDHDRLIPADGRDPSPARPARPRRARRPPSTKRPSGARSPRVITLQEELGLDVLVHGEPERNDMVQYFAEHLAGSR